MRLHAKSPTRLSEFHFHFHFRRASPRKMSPSSPAMVLRGLGGKGGRGRPKHPASVSHGLLVHFTDAHTVPTDDTHPGPHVTHIQGLTWPCPPGTWDIAVSLPRWALSSCSNSWGMTVVISRCLSSFSCTHPHLQQCPEVPSCTGRVPSQRSAAGLAEREAHKLSTISTH